MISEIEERMRCVIYLFLVSILFSACRKDPSEIIPDNNAPAFTKVPSVKIRNYVNRLFIDLIGREPLDEEMNLETYNLLQANASSEARENLVKKLMCDSTFVEGDTSYSLAYFKRVYDLNKIRFIEGVSDDALRGEASIYRNNAISDSLSNNIPGYEQKMAEHQKIVNVLNSAFNLKSGSISLFDQYAFMVNNHIYDFINMNSFNFVNACFDDLLFRFPSQNEFSVAYDMVENNVPAALFQQAGQSKSDFVEIITASNECLQGVIIWSYLNLLNREPSSQELYNEMLLFSSDENLQNLQTRILITNEYANF